MAEDQDRLLAQLAVEAGFLSQEDAVRYWQRTQAPGSPRFVPLLLQERRLSPPQVEALKVRFYANQRLRSAASGMAPVPTAEDAAATALDAPPGPPQSDTFMSAGTKTLLDAPGVSEGSETILDRPRPDAVWEDALAKDTLLARVLMQRRLASPDMLRECRKLQLQHRMRLGVVLVQKGYVPRQVVETAIQTVQTELNKSGLPDAPTAVATYQAAATQLDAGSSQATIFDGSPPIPLPPIFDVPTVLDGPKVIFDPGSQEETPTVLNQQAVKADPFASFATGRSLEELNPFAGMGAPPASPLKSAKVTRATAIKQPIPSVDELDAFADVPLPPPPSPGANESGLDIPLPGQGPPAGPGSQPGALVDAFEAAPLMGNRNSGFTKTGVPVGGEVDSGSTRMKAREKAQLKRATVKRRKVKSKGGNFPLLVLLMLIGGLAIAGGLYFLLDLMN